MTVYTHKVQYYETDQMQIVHHSNYIRWFEEARCALLDIYGFGYDVVEKMGILSPVLSVSADYKTMTHFGETVCIEVRISYYNGYRMNFTYTVKDAAAGAVRCTGETKHCFLSDGKVLNLRRAAPEVHAALLSAAEKDKETESL